MRSSRVPLVVAVLLSLVWFLPAMGGEFLTWDDDRNFLMNQSYRGLGWDQIRWMFTTVLLGHWQPLTWVTLGLDYVLWGMQPWGYHLTNLLLHGVNATLLFFLIRAVLRRASPDAEAASIDWAAAAGVVLFAAHPLRVESVAWITERRQLLTAAFLLTSVMLHLRRRAWAAGLAHALAMLSSTWGVVLPPLLVLLDGYFGRAGRRRLSYWVALLPFAAIAAIGLAVNILACAAAGTGRSLADHSIVQRAMQASFGLCFYLARTILPVSQTPLHELEAHLDPWTLTYLASLAAVAVVFVALALGRRRRPGLWTAWLCYAVVLFPVLGLYQPVGLPLVAERYSYLALMPWSAVVAAVVLRNRRFRFAPATVLALLLGPLTARYLPVWRDSVSLWTRAVDVHGQSMIARTNLGHALELREKFDEAADQYRLSLAIRPDEPRTRYKLGLVYARLERYEAAIAEWRRVLEVAPAKAELHFSIGLASFRLGRALEAVAAYRRAIALQPDYVEAHRALGEALAALGRTAEARRALDTARAVTRPYRPPY